MSITVKPTSYTVNTGHAKCPNHLWMFDEGTGTTAADKGKGTALNITLDNADMWGTDGTFGPIISTNEAGPRKAISATGTLPSTSIVMVVICKSATATASANEYPMGSGNSGVNGANYFGMRVQTDEALDAIGHDGTGLVVNNANIANAYDTTMRMLAFKAKANALGCSVDGGAWTTSAPTMAFPVSTGSAPNRFIVGDRGDGGAAAQNFNGSFLAAMAWDDLYDTADDTWISNLFSNPWQFLNTSSTAILAHYYNSLRTP